MGRFSWAWALSNWVDISIRPIPLPFGPKNIFSVDRLLNKQMGIQIVDMLFKPGPSVKPNSDIMLNK